MLVSGKVRNVGHLDLSRVELLCLTLFDVISKAREHTFSRCMIEDGSKYTAESAANEWGSHYIYGLYNDYT